MRRVSLIVLTALLLQMGGSNAGAGAPAGSAQRATGFRVSTVTSALSEPTAVVTMDDGRLVVLEQPGRVRIVRRDGVMPARPALTVPNICAGGERGLLGFAQDPRFADNGFVYLYFTRVAPRAPGGCVNRVSRFVMTGGTIDWATQAVLVDGISSVNGNHNGGDLGFGADGYLYVSTGDAGADPRGDSGSAGANDAARDLSLLNGKILRITRTGRPAPGNPIAGDGTARCARRGNTAATPRTLCQELVAWGLRNPFRMAFDPDAAGTRWFVNDVGQSTREEVNRGRIGADYGWNIREGRCPQGQNPPCAGPPAGLTDPIVDYPHSLGYSITAGAFVPQGSWPSRFDRGYLFADFGSGSMWLRTASGATDLSRPVLTGLGGIVDMSFRTESGRLVLYATISDGRLLRITHT